MVQQRNPLLPITPVQGAHFGLCQIAPFKAPFGKAFVNGTSLAMRANVAFIGRNNGRSDDDPDKKDATDVMPGNGVPATLRCIGRTGLYGLTGGKQALPRLAWHRRPRKVSASRQKTHSEKEQTPHPVSSIAKILC